MKCKTFNISSLKISQTLFIEIRVIICLWNTFYYTWFTANTSNQFDGLLDYLEKKTSLSYSSLDTKTKSMKDSYTKKRNNT